MARLGTPTAPASPIRIAIFGDSSLFFEGLRQMVAVEPSMVVAGGADGVPSRSLVAETAPDILVIDARIDDALTLCREFAPAGGHPRVILVAAEGDLDWTVRAVEAGARGVLDKAATAAELLSAIRAVHAGQIWVRHQVVARIVEQFVLLMKAKDPEQVLLAQRLSAREREVVRHVVEGLSNQEVADQLGSTEATVKAHLTHIFQKLEVRDRAQLVARYHHAVHRGAPVPVRLTT